MTANDQTEVAKEIASEWDHYQNKFIESTWPNIEDSGPSLTFQRVSLAGAKAHLLGTDLTENTTMSHYEQC